MRKLNILCIAGFLVLASCNSSQNTVTKSADSLDGQKNPKDSAQLELAPEVGKDTDNIVKAEAPDALNKYEQGYGLPKTEDSNAQSPVDIISSQVQEDLTHRLTVKVSGSIVAVENMGHTVQVDFNPGSVIVVNGKSFELKQLHFHTPSEHLIDGITYPMEMHIVSILNDSIKKEGSTYTVLGILFRIGHESKFIQEFLGSTPNTEGKNILDSQKVRLSDFLIYSPEAKMTSFYNYHGSLTTPPYAESVNWVICKRIFEASEEQIQSIEKMEGDNARHVRALNKRKITGY